MQNLGSNADFKYYGIVETVGGFLKVCLVLGTSILSYVIAAKCNVSKSHTDLIKEERLTSFLLVNRGGSSGRRWQDN
jgi:hypothetical protein